MNCQKRTLSFLFSIMTLSACGGLDGTTSVDEGAFGEAGLETMEQALSRESAEGQGLAAAIPAKGKIWCNDRPVNIYSNATQADKDCEIEYSNTCGDKSELFTRVIGGGAGTGPRLQIQETPEDSTADVSIRVPAGSELVFKCCGEGGGGRKYESVCVAAETQDDAK